VMDVQLLKVDKRSTIEYLRSLLLLLRKGVGRVVRC